MQKKPVLMLRHSGVMGMHWGIRKDIRGAYENSATKNLEIASNKRAEAGDAFKTASEIQSRPWRQKRLGDGHRIRSLKKQGFDKTDAAYFREAKAKRMANVAKALGSEKFDPKPVRQERERFDRGAKPVYDKPYRPSDRDSNKSAYNDALKKIGLAVATAVVVGLVKPTAEAYGKNLAAKLVK
jgi:hypothetical protein